MKKLFVLLLSFEVVTNLFAQQEDKVSSNNKPKEYIRREALSFNHNLQPIPYSFSSCYGYIIYKRASFLNITKTHNKEEIVTEGDQLGLYEKKN